MKTTHFLITILAIALAGLTAKIALTNNQITETSSTEQITTVDAIDNILTRTSIRAYNDSAISDDKIDTLLRAAMAAPTAMNRQPWQFVVVNDRVKLDSIASKLRGASMAVNAQIAIAVCGDMSKTIEGDGRDFWIQDCSAATENLLLAAHSLGLGAVWCGVYPIENNVKNISSILELPDHIIPLNIIPIGYPKTPSAPKQKYDNERIHFNKY